MDPIKKLVHDRFPYGLQHLQNVILTKGPPSVIVPTVVKILSKPRHHEGPVNKRAVFGFDATDLRYDRCDVQLPDGRTWNALVENLYPLPDDDMIVQQELAHMDRVWGAERPAKGDVAFDTKAHQVVIVVSAGNDEDHYVYMVTDHIPGMITSVMKRTNVYEARLYDLSPLSGVPSSLGRVTRRL